jgi:hypothetical protein
VHIEAQEMGAIVAIESMLCSDPQLAGGILEHTQGGKVAQALWAGIQFEAVALAEGAGGQSEEQNADETG